MLGNSLEPNEHCLSTIDADLDADSGVEGGHTSGFSGYSKGKGATVTGTTLLMSLRSRETGLVRKGRGGP